MLVVQQYVEDAEVPLAMTSVDTTMVSRTIPAFLLQTLEFSYSTNLEGSQIQELLK